MPDLDWPQRGDKNAGKRRVVSPFGVAQRSPRRRKNQKSLGGVQGQNRIPVTHVPVQTFYNL